MNSINSSIFSPHFSFEFDHHSPLSRQNFSFTDNYYNNGSLRTNTSTNTNSTISMQMPMTMAMPMPIPVSMSMHMPISSNIHHHHPPPPPPPQQQQHISNYHSTPYNFYTNSPLLYPNQSPLSNNISNTNINNSFENKRNYSLPSFSPLQQQQQQQQQQPIINRHMSAPACPTNNSNGNLKLNLNDSLILPAQTPTTSTPNSLTNSRKGSSFNINNSNGYKRHRKKYNEIERYYKCNFKNCDKAYGTLNHLNTHISIQGHGKKRLPIEFSELRKILKQKRINSKINNNNNNNNSNNSNNSNSNSHNNNKLKKIDSFQFRFFHSDSSTSAAGSGTII